VDRSVIEPMPAKQVEVCRGHPLLIVSELGGQFTQGPIGGRQRCRSPVPGDGVDQGIRLLVRQLPGDLVTEVVRVRLDSVVTVKLPGHDHREHLSLNP
jgi:hypothetical protein